MNPMVWSSMLARDPVDVDQRGDGVDRRLAQLDAEQVARLVEGRVAGLGLDEVGPGDAPVLRGLLPVGEHGVADAAGAAAGDEARRLAVGDRVGVEEVERHGDDLALVAGGARADVALEDVDVGVQPEHVVHEGVVVVVAAVHGAGHPARSPRRRPPPRRASASRRGPRPAGRPCSGSVRLTGNRSWYG